MLRNGETCDKKWLVYSKELDRVFCFCCKLFKVIHSRSQLTKEGIRDWKHVSEKLTQDENCLVHLTNMHAWSELIKRLSNSQTIDNIELERIRNDQLYWKQVMIRVIAVVKCLAIHNLAFRGSNDKPGDDCNGNFLGLLETIAVFDPIMQ
ncbi:hypothetical protein ACOSQ4_014669 [Xanthoceras sorbifolium]